MNGVGQEGDPAYQMTISHEEIMITVIPDEYHIRFAGKKSDGSQVFVTADLKYDAAAGKTTDFIVVYNWDHQGNFIDAQVTKIGTRGEYDNAEAAKIHDQIEASIKDFVLDTIKVKPCRFMYEGIEFGFIPRTDDEFTVVELMPGNCLCFLEPFDGEYDT